MTILLLIGLVLYFILGNKKETKEVEKKFIQSFSVKEDKRVNMCVNPGCFLKDETIYPHIELD